MVLYKQKFGKRDYHPLVLFFYYTYLLSPEQIKLIPKTTRDYWNNSIQADMYGYEWVKDFAINYQQFNQIEKHKIIFKPSPSWP